MELVIARIEELQRALAAAFEEVVTDVPVACGLSGGATALIFLSALRQARVNWGRVALFWVDERAVGPDDPASNYGVARRMLLDPLGARAPRAYRIEGERTDLENAAEFYDSTLAGVLDGRPLDLVILGVGEDGHVASLFPGDVALLDPEARVVVVEDAPRPPRRRITLTLPYLMAAGRVWLVVVGERKRQVLQIAMLGAGQGSPLDRLLAGHRHVTVFTDQMVHRR
jgi:6-phosphogluconolactonase